MQDLDGCPTKRIRKWSFEVILEKDLEGLCHRDQEIIRRRMVVPTKYFDSRFTIVPNIDHLDWHLGKEDFATKFLFGKSPTSKGVIVGAPGSQIWATLVVGLDETATRLSSDARKRPEEDIFEEQSWQLKAVVEAAQAEAAEWKLDLVKLWDPTPLVLDSLAHRGIEYVVTDRQEHSIASLLWYGGDDGGPSKSLPFWVKNEHYAWQ